MWCRTRGGPVASGGTAMMIIKWRNWTSKIKEQNSARSHRTRTIANWAPQTGEGRGRFATAVSHRDLICDGGPALPRRGCETRAAPGPASHQGGVGRAI